MPVPSRILLDVKSDEYTCLRWSHDYIQFTARSPKYILKIGLFGNGSETEEAAYELVIDVETKNVSLYKKGFPRLLVCLVSAPCLLHAFEWRGFWIYFSNNTIHFGREYECEALLQWTDEAFVCIEKIGFKAQEHFLRMEAICVEVFVDVFTTSKPPGIRWLHCTNENANLDNAFIGAYDGDTPLYVGRGYNRGALTPGQIKGADLESCDISWGGNLHRLTNFEVLVDFDGDWIKNRLGQIPPLAVLAGRTEDNFPLYIGRTTQEGITMIGKVQPNHKVLYIPLHGRERAFEEYEILCYKEPGLSRIPYPLEEVKYKPKLKWVYSCLGRLPRNAFVAGYNGDEAVFIIRVTYEDSWALAKLSNGVTTHSLADPSEEYEVLCDFRGYWEKPVGQHPPDNVVRFNTSGSYIGRVWINGIIHIGEVDSELYEGENMKCSVHLEDEEMLIPDFEILCFPNEVTSFTKNGLNKLTNAS